MDYGVDHAGGCGGEFSYLPGVVSGVYGMLIWLVDDGWEGGQAGAEG